MKLFPAIDIRGGKVVRLSKGDFDAETVYGEDPVSVAKGFQSAGAEWVHIVDLDAAKTGSQTNLEIISSVTAALDIPVQCGGGVRDADAAERLLRAGVSRIVIGTAAVERPALVEQLAQEHPGAVAVGLDARAGKVAVHGWLEESDIGVVDMAKRFEASGVAALIVTDIERDGMLQGPDVAGLEQILAATSVPVVASGGVGQLDDIERLAHLKAAERSLEGVIVGKAIYEGKVDVAQAVATLKAS